MKNTFYLITNSVIMVTGSYILKTNFLGTHPFITGIILMVIALSYLSFTSIFYKIIGDKHERSETNAYTIEDK